MVGNLAVKSSCNLGQLLFEGNCGSVFVHDFMVEDDRQGPPLAALWALQHAVFTPGAVSITPGALTALLEEAGFVVPDRQPSPTVDKVLGYAVQEEPARLDVPADKAIALQGALLAAARQNKVSVSTEAFVLGTWICGALLRRDFLSIPSAIFGFVERCRDQTVCWWPTARREAVAMAKVVPCLFATLRRTSAT